MDIISFIIPVAQAATEATHLVTDAMQTATEVAHTTEPGIAGTFGLNWKVFLAQLVNFAIVVFVLWKWVLTPLAKRLQERHDKIKQGLIDAESAEVSKKEFEDWKKQEIREVKTEAAGIITDAKKEAESLKQSIVASAKVEQEKMIQQAKEEMHSEEMKAIGEVKKEIADLVVAATEKILKKKLSASDDKEIVKEAITEAIKKSKK